MFKDFESLFNKIDTDIVKCQTRINNLAELNIQKIQKYKSLEIFEKNLNHARENMLIKNQLSLQEKISNINEARDVGNYIKPYNFLKEKNCTVGEILSLSKNKFYPKLALERVFFSNIIKISKLVTINYCKVKKIDNNIIYNYHYLNFEDDSRNTPGAPYYPECTNPDNYLINFEGEKFKRLFKYGADINYRQRFLSLIEYLIENKKKEEFDFIMDLGADPNLDFGSSPPLICAINNCINFYQPLELDNVYYVKKLIEYGADVNIKGWDGLRSIDILYSYFDVFKESFYSISNNFSLVGYLLECGSVEPKNDVLLEFAIKTNDYLLAKNIISKEKDIQKFCKLLYNCVFKSDTILELLIRNGININYNDLNHPKIITELIKLKKNKLIKIAIEYGAKLD